jgi:hypothetical protein
VFHKLVSKPAGPPGRDGYQWRVGLEEDVLLVVELSGTAGIETQLGTTGLNERLPAAFQRYAAGRLRSDQPVLDQVLAWDSPVALRADDFG